MKILILACLVALALAREKEELTVSTETVESLSSSEESITHINKQKFENFKHEEQQQKEDERQNKIHPLSQQQPLIYPYADPIPYAVLPQNVLPLAQPAVVMPFPQPEIMEVPKVKENIFPRRQVMPFLKSPVVPFLNSQIQNLAGLENLYFPQPQPQPQPHPLPLPLPLPLLQPLLHQIPQSLPQTHMLTPQPLLSIPQSKVLPFPQQVMPYPQRDMPLQAFLLFQEPSREAHPVTQPIAPVYNSAIVSPNLLALLSHL
ncbi:beta-casein [Neomonachus schauinslandi]|uniref:Beta-casein n=1 Tax=Neomonachus schauinslandi TaxID=29088 RepID=A0A2Y9I2E1_NEOSC|nr:beta-casein [Neomonachus schauinslandi]